jgi:hypothetical protein
MATLVEFELAIERARRITKHDSGRTSLHRSDTALNSEKILSGRATLALTRTDIKSRERILATTVRLTRHQGA